MTVKGFYTPYTKIVSVLLVLVTTGFSEAQTSQESQSLLNTELLLERQATEPRITDFDTSEAQGIRTSVANVRKASSARWEGYLNPGGLVSGSYGLEMGYRATPKWVVGGGLFVINKGLIFKNDRNGFEAGLKLTHYFQSVSEEGYYINTRFYYTSSELVYVADKLIEREDGIWFGITPGYQWRPRSLSNSLLMSTGLGIRFASTHRKVEDTLGKNYRQITEYDVEKTLADIELQVGMEF